MKFKKITYLIGQMDGRSKTVTGFAVDWSPVRFCVRKAARNEWVIDHFDTGCGVEIHLMDWPAKTKEDAAALAIGIFQKAIKSGLYQKKVANYQELIGRGQYLEAVV